MVPSSSVQQVSLASADSAWSAAAALQNPWTGQVHRCRTWTRMFVQLLPHTLSAFVGCVRVPSTM